MSTTAQDNELLFQYGERRSDDAFAELVRRHIDVVYSTARRVVREPTIAEGVTQQVAVDYRRVDSQNHKYRDHP